MQRLRIIILLKTDNAATVVEVSIYIERTLWDEGTGAG